MWASFPTANVWDLSFQYMLQAHLKNHLDVFVFERIEALFAFSANLDEILLPQYSELVGDGRLLHPDDVGDTADGELFFKQRAHDADAGGVAEHLEEVSKLKQRVGIGHILFDGCDDFGMIIV